MQNSAFIEEHQNCCNTYLVQFQLSFCGVKMRLTIESFIYFDVKL